MDFDEYIKKQLSNIKEFEALVIHLSKSVERNLQLIKENEELRKENKALEDELKGQQHLLSVSRHDIRCILDEKKIDYDDDEVEDTFEWIAGMEFDERIYKAHKKYIEKQVVKHLKSLKRY